MFKVYDQRMSTNLGCPVLREFETLDEVQEFLIDYCSEEANIWVKEDGTDEFEFDKYYEMVMGNIIIEEGKSE